LRRFFGSAEIGAAQDDVLELFEMLLTKVFGDAEKADKKV
jgi:hypothetical protein